MALESHNFQQDTETNKCRPTSVNLQKNSTLFKSELLISMPPPENCNFRDCDVDLWTM